MQMTMLVARRRAALAPTLGGIFWIAFQLYYILSGIDYRQIGSSILLAGLGALFMVLAVLALLRGPHLGTAGRVGAGILLVGLVLFALGAILAGLNLWRGAWFLAIGGEALSALGLVAFGCGALAQAPRAVWKWLPLLVAPAYFISFTTTAESLPNWAPAYTPEWLAVLYGIGWILLGFLLPYEGKHGRMQSQAWNKIGSGGDNSMTEHKPWTGGHCR